MIICRYFLNCNIIICKSSKEKVNKWVLYIKIYEFYRDYFKLCKYILVFNFYQFNEKFTILNSI